MLAPATTNETKINLVNRQTDARIPWVRAETPKVPRLYAMIA